MTRDYTRDKRLCFTFEGLLRDRDIHRDRRVTWTALAILAMFLIMGGGAVWDFNNFFKSVTYRLTLTLTKITL